MARGGEAGNAAVALVSALKLLAVAIHTVLIAPVVVAVALVDQRAAYRICQLWARLNLLIYAVRVRTTLLAPLDPSASYVFVSNHRSQFDILALITALLDFQLRWVAKVELTRVPVFGWALKHSGHVIIDRSNHLQAIASLRAARTKMEQGVSVMIFPEGTRGTLEGPLLPFKKGGFILAMKAGVPIVPVSIYGGHQVLPKGSLRVRPGTIHVIFGAPISTSEYSPDSPSKEDLIATVRERIATGLQIPPAASGRRG